MVIKWTKTAFDDLDEFKLITKKNNASEYIFNLFEFSKQLKDFPNLGTISYYTRKIVIRKLIYQEHSILYYVNNNTIYIIAVIHHKQDTNKKLKSIKKYLNNN